MGLDDLLGTQTADVCLKAPTQDATGAPQRDPYVVVAPAVPVLIRTTGGDTVQRGDKRTQVRTATLYIDPANLPTGFLLTAKHQLRVPDTHGRVFVILRVSDPNEMGHHLEVECEEQPA